MPYWLPLENNSCSSDLGNILEGERNPVEWEDQEICCEIVPYKWLGSYTDDAAEILRLKQGMNDDKTCAC